MSGAAALDLKALAANAARAEPRLPALREDLTLLPARNNRDGSPAWLIHDPVANRFCRIGWLEFELLARWQPSPSRLLEAVRAETTLAPDTTSLSALLHFLAANCLLRADDAPSSERLAAISARERRRDLRWLLHHYLFIRIPLVRPERFLGATLPAIAFIYTRAFALAITLLTLTGLVLASRQWDSFAASVQGSFTASGAAAYLTALAAAKVLHELGHAYTATRYGVRVAHMGVSFVVLFPMLYTDTSESWKLADHRHRLAIVAAGLTTELAIAGLATLGWSLAEDGPLRSALFFLATTSWVLSLAINASPFMRFDGYFLLSDLLDLPNLHQRASAYGRAYLRRRLLGLHDPEPEALSRPLARFLTAFAFMTWTYRLVVFVGIAVAVYLFFFKALGIVLFVVEIGWFVALPLWSEARVWWARRKEVPRSRKRRALGVLAAIALVLVLPLPYSIHAPAFVRAERTVALYAPYPARVTQLHAAGPVAAGTVLLALDSPDTRARGAHADAVTATLWSQLQRTGAADDPESRRPLSSRLQQELAESRSAKEEESRLVLTAAFAGVLSDLDPLVQAGTWVNPQQPLGVLVDPASWVVDAYVDQNSLRHLEPGARATVYVAERSAPLSAVVVAVDTVRTLVPPDPMLDAAHGGPIKVSNVHGRQEIQQALYRVRLKLDAPPPSRRTQLARAVIRGTAHARAADWLRAAVSVLVRESGL